jgi:AraC-like DNA-binding protein
MSTVFRAADEPVRTRLEYWHHVMSSALGPLDLRAPDDPDFRDRFAVGHLGAVRVGDLYCSGPGQGDRRSNHTRRGDRDMFWIGVQVSGRMVVEQGGRQACLEPGDLTLIDLSRPCRWTTPTSRVTAVAFPRELLPLHPDGLAALTAVRIPGDRGPGALASTFARSLPRHLDDLDGPGAARLGTTVLDLLTTTVATCLDRPGEVPAPTRQRALLTQIHAFIEQHLADPDLSPGVVAAANHISVRYLHRLFETEQMTVADRIRTRRLERCLRDLLDPLHAAEPVRAIAARWGFRDPAHFSRLFRNTYGDTPSRYRERTSD